MQIEIGKKYKIVGKVSAAHGNCQGNMVTCTSVDEYGNTSFYPLYWQNSLGEGDYILCPPSELSYLEGEDYTNWLATVLAEV